MTSFMTKRVERHEKSIMTLKPKTTLDFLNKPPATKPVKGPSPAQTAGDPILEGTDGGDADNNSSGDYGRAKYRYFGTKIKKTQGSRRMGI
jgi:hypothetical protein